MYLDSSTYQLIAVRKEDLEKFKLFALENSLSIQVTEDSESAQAIESLAANLQYSYQESYEESWEDSGC